MLFRNAFFLVLIFACSSLSAQLYDESGIQNLQLLFDKLTKEQELRKSRVSEFMQSKSILDKMSIQSNLAKGYVLYDIQNGKPLYKKPFNEDAADAMGIGAVREGGALGLNLQGEGLNIGIWDGGLIRTTHQEFAGRINYFDGAASSVFSDHATGVAGTLLGTGLSSGTRGMAPMATGIAYDFNNDEAEMVQAQMLREILVSNHSYGLITGWNDGQWFGDATISEDEDWRFGFYDNQAKTWDDIAYNAPYYLIVKSAGNDRGDSGSGPYPSDGPYDSVASSSVSKNIMVVGAVQKSNNGYDNPSNIAMSTFSGWGPTDDGRIKPDIVGIGVSVNTSAAGSNTDYQVTSGTSFSSPAVCGGLALVQEFHFNKYNRYMLSSSLKALAIHTAKQTGEPGPDYRFGWGLMNVEGAVDFIQKEDGISYQIIEDRLEDNTTKTYEIDPQDGTEVRLTLVWTDPSGNPVAASLDPMDGMLVNDLDIRLTDETGNSFEPYILDPANPQNGAITGDNFRDNVEQVYVDMIDERKYFVNITHKGSLTPGFQDFSLIIEYTSSNNQLTSLYWIGNEGTWDNGNNWSLNSGGNAANILPNENYRIIIDDNSITTDNATITLDKSYQVGSISTFATRPYTIDLNGFELESSGNIKLNDDELQIKNGTIVCNSDLTNSALSINMDGVSTEDVIILIPETNSSTWQIIENTINVSRLNFFGGGLEIMSSVINADQFDAGIQDEPINNNLTISETELNIRNLLDFVGCSSLMNDRNSSANFINGSDALFYAADFSYNMSVNIENSNIGIVSNQASFRDLVSNNSGFGIVGNSSFNTIDIIGDARIEFQSDSDLNVRSAFNIDPTGQTEPILFTGNENGTSSLTLDFHEKLCFDNLDINNVSLLGEASVSIGVNSTINNSPGWSSQACDNLLFSDFDVMYPCASALTEFNDLSEGNPVSWEWFVNGSFRTNQQNLYVTFPNPGNVEIRLTVMGSDGSSSTYSRSIEIMDTPLDSNTVIQSTPEILASQRPADAYQWYKNDEPIPGETGRTYRYNGEIADYYVVTFEGGCNRKSKELKLLTSTEEVITAGLLGFAFPNPLNDVLYLNLELLDEPQVRIELMDIHGKRLMSRDIYNVQGQLDWNFAPYSDGLYILNLITQNNTYSFKLVKN